jgi:acetyl esterase
MTFTLDATPESRHAAMITMTAPSPVPKHPVHEVTDRTIPGPAGEIPVRVFRPCEDHDLPLLLWFHAFGAQR